MKTVGLITYHSAYNFGSALQAYASQIAIERLGYRVDIINYRMKSQKAHYSLVRTTGPRAFINDLGMLSLYSRRKTRQESFEEFFSSYLNLGDEFQNPDDFTKHISYDMMVSGSDQIWNKHSNELRHVDWKYMNPYLLKGFKGKKISYASSVADMQENDLSHMKNSLLSFNYISMREASGSEKVGHLLGRKISTVLDPTLLLTKSEWLEKIPLDHMECNQRYILFYSLADRRIIEKFRTLIETYAAKGYVIKYVTPYANAPFMGKFENCIEFGPTEFLAAISGADIVITDSYHGTLFSINFHKNFYSINGQYQSDNRKLEILNQVGLQNRVISWNSEYSDLDNEAIDYSHADQILILKRKESFEYLRNALEV